MASEEMSFENVDNGRRRQTEGRRLPAYTISSPKNICCGYSMEFLMSTHNIMFLWIIEENFP